MRKLFEKLPAEKNEKRIKYHLIEMKGASSINLFNVFREKFQKAGGELSTAEMNSLRRSALEKHMKKLEGVIKVYENMKAEFRTKDFERRFKNIRGKLSELKEEYKKLTGPEKRVQE